MNVLIRKWRKAFEKPVKGKMTEANLKFFRLLFLEEFKEVLEHLVTEEILMSEHWDNLKQSFNVINSSPIPPINKQAITKEIIDLEHITQGEGCMLNDFPYDEVNIAVHLSNMSKLCDTEGEAMQSCSTDNPHLKIETDRVKYRKTEEGKFIIYDQETGKTLKGINYKSYKNFL